MKVIKFRAMIKCAKYLMPVCLIDFANGVEVEDIRDERLEHYFYEWYKVEALEQFTGLLDKNGKEIYEGDVVKYGPTDCDGDWHTGESEISNVVYYGDKGYPAFDLEPHPEHEMNALAYIKQSGEQEIEIIGNIHEKRINK